VVWLIDRLTGAKTDLRNVSELEFKSTAGDPTNRFVVQFARNANWSDNPDSGEFKIYYNSGSKLVTVEGLVESDLESVLIIADAQGKILDNVVVGNNDIPKMELPSTLVDGVYIARLKGKRNQAAKFIVKH
jgi:hypothetical protein